jgi:VPS62-like protein
MGDAGEPKTSQRLALQYWFFYYFNNFNDKHEADWEGLQLVFNVDSARRGLLTEPVEVGYAQHEGGEQADWDSEKVEKVGNHPIVYSAAGSHASYYSSALWLGTSAREGVGCDDTRGRRLRNRSAQSCCLAVSPPAAALTRGLRSAVAGVRRSPGRTTALRARTRSPDGHTRSNGRTTFEAPASRCRQEDHLAKA